MFTFYLATMVAWCSSHAVFVSRSYKEFVSSFKFQVYLFIYRCVATRLSSRLISVSYVTRGPFLDSPETFRAHFGWQFALYLQSQGVSKPKTLQIFSFLFPLQHMKRPALINNGAAGLRKAFRARKVFGTFEKFKVLEIEAFGRTWTIEVISIDV